MRIVFHALLLVVSLLSGCKGREARKSMMIAGDSNTHFLPCAYPLELQRRHDVSAFHVYDEGVFGSAAWGWIRDDSMRPRLEADQPGIVVIALGTNDINGANRRPDRVVNDLAQLCDQVQAFTRHDGSHPRAYVATVPPIYYPPEQPSSPPTPQRAAHVEDQIRLLNALIRFRFKNQVVDFDSWMPDRWTAGMMNQPRDGKHIGCDAHRIRADILDKIR